MFAGGTAAKIFPGNQNAGSGVTWLVQRESGIHRTVSLAPPVVEQEFSETGFLNALEELFGNDLVGIHIGAEERNNFAGVNSKWLHKIYVAPGRPRLGRAL